MLIDLVRLKNDIDEYINIDFKYSFGEEFLKQTDLIKLDDVSIKGEITKNSLDDIELHLKIDGVMVLPCAITLKPVNYSFSIEFDKSLEEICEETTENLKKDENTLDIFQFLWENIVLEIPLQFTKVKDLSKFHGDGWKLVSEDELTTRNNPFSDLLKDFEEE